MLCSHRYVTPKGRLVRDETTDLMGSGPVEFVVHESPLAFSWVRQEPSEGLKEKWDGM